MAISSAGLDSVSDEQFLAEFKQRFPARVKAPYPRTIFSLLNEYRPAVTFEAVIWRKVGDSIEVLLRDRSESEDYPLACHVAGGYMLQHEQSSEVLDRIVAKEIGPEVKIVSADCAGILFDRYEERGPQVHIVYVLKIEGKPSAPSTHWESIEHLELVPHLLDYHRELLEEIARPVIAGLRLPSITKELLNGSFASPAPS